MFYYGFNYQKKNKKNMKLLKMRENLGKKNYYKNFQRVIDHIQVGMKICVVK